MTFTVHFAHIRPSLQCLWTGDVWQRAEQLELSHFRPEGSRHRPRTSARLLYDAVGIFGIFTVEDRYVRCLRTNYADQVYKDSCVEFFVQPKPGGGYFNFEFNCCGALLCSYIIDPRRTETGFRHFIAIPEEDGRQVKVCHTMPQTVEPEITVPVDWLLEFFIPFSLLEKYAGPLGTVKAQTWRANFNKCGDETSHPHWGSWSQLKELNFHMPECFGTIRFE